MPAFIFRLELTDGSAADPPILHAAVPNWGAVTRSISRIERCGWWAVAMTMPTSRPC
jgi:hypothetical protein